MQTTQQQKQPRAREMTWDEFEQEFGPLVDLTDGTFMMFTKDNWEYLRDRSNSHPGTVWTFMDDGEGGTLIGDGLHRVNALHWIITRVPADPGVTYIVDHEPCSSDDEEEGPKESGTFMDLSHLGYPMEVSLDGGDTWQLAPEGVRIAYKGVMIDGKDGTGEVHLNCTHEGVITDIWATREEPLDHNIGTDCVLIDDIVSRLVNEND